MSTPNSRCSTRLIATCVLLRGATTATSLFPDCSYFRNSREFFKATDNSFSECSFLFTRMRSNVQCWPECLLILCSVVSIRVFGFPFSILACNFFTATVATSFGSGIMLVVSFSYSTSTKVKSQVFFFDHM